MAEKVSDKTLALIKKLQALAERGIGGERARAKVMLDKMLRRHGLALESLEGEGVEN